MTERGTTMKSRVGLLNNISLSGTLGLLLGDTFTSRGLSQKTVTKIEIMATGKKVFQWKFTKEYLKQNCTEEVKYSALLAY